MTSSSSGDPHNRRPCFASMSTRRWRRPGAGPAARPGPPRPGAACAAWRRAAAVRRPGRRMAGARAGHGPAVGAGAGAGARAVDRELPLAVTLAVGMPANERMDWLVEKATELGVAALQPLLCERSVLRLDGERAERKREHWQAQAVAAAEQCGRTRVPVVQPVRRLADWLPVCPPAGHALAAQPAGGATAARPAAGCRWWCSAAPKAGCRRQRSEPPGPPASTAVQLGPRVLRAETAPLAVLAWLGLTMNHAEYLRHDATALAALVRRGEVSAGRAAGPGAGPGWPACSRGQRRGAADGAAGARADRRRPVRAAGRRALPAEGRPAGLRRRAHRGGQPVDAALCADAACGGDHAPLPGRRAGGLRQDQPARVRAQGGQRLAPARPGQQPLGPDAQCGRLQRRRRGRGGRRRAADGRGSDGGGSLRIPAACCGLFALKPSRGRISEAPLFGEVWFGACTHGVLSRSVRDSALALDLLCGPEPGDPFISGAPASPSCRRSGAPRAACASATARSPIGTPVHPEAVAAVERAVALLRGLGHEVEEAAPAIDGRALARAYLCMYLGRWRPKWPSHAAWAPARATSNC
jgi:hypothetical protein